MEGYKPEPYTPTPNNFNNACFLNPETTTLTLASASKYFFKKSGDSAAFVNAGAYQIGGITMLSTALTNITLGVATANKSIVLDGSKNITGINNLTIEGQTILANLVSTGVTVNGNQIIEKTTGDLLTLNSTDLNSRSTIKFNCPTVNLEVGIRSSTTSNYPDHYYRYANGAYRYIQSCTSGLSTNFGSFIADSDSNQFQARRGSALGVINQKENELTITTSINNNTSLNIDTIGLNIVSTGSHLTLKRGSDIAFFEVTSTSLLRIIDGTTSLCISDGGVRIDSSSNNSPARGRLDLGSSASDKTLILFNNTSSLYAVSANNNALQYSSHQNHVWYTGSTDATPLGTQIMSLASNGVLTISNNAVLNKGWFVQRSNFSSLGRSGRGMACHFATTQQYGELFCYNYDTNSKDSIVLGQTLFIGANNGHVGINVNNSTEPIYPLTVSGAFITSFGGSYGYLNQSGAGTGSGTGSVQVSCFLQHRLWCSEVNAFSDKRLKEQLHSINEEDAIDFVRNITPKHFSWRADENKTRCIGYIAQEILAFDKFKELISVAPDEDLKEEIETIDGKKFVSPDKARLLVSYQNITPILHSGLASAFDVIEELQNNLEAVFEKLEKNSKIIKDLEEDIINLRKRIT